MGREPASRQETNTDRAIRIRDNKRRHRLRQKEYMADLERKVADSREQGIQVTKEVQLAAQRVTRENARLKDLLRRTGYTDEVIDAWAREDYLQFTEHPQLVLTSTPADGMRQVASACDSQRGRELEPQDVSVKEGKSVLVKTHEGGKCLTKSSLRMESHDKRSSESPIKGSSAVCAKSSSSSQFSDSVGAPCKLVTLLAENPAADITQVQLLTESDHQQRNISNRDDCNLDGIECSAAYKMLIQYAASEEKMDRIAAALEGGCTPSATGGCEVKKSVVWAALDEECT